MKKNSGWPSPCSPMPPRAWRRRWPVSNKAGQAALAVTIAGDPLVPQKPCRSASPRCLVGLLAINPGMRLPPAGFTSEVTFFWVGVAAMGGFAVETSGLGAARRALPGAQCARATPTRLYTQMILSLPVLAFLRAVGDYAQRHPNSRPIARRWTAWVSASRAASAAALMLALGMLNPLASSALLTGGIGQGGFSWLGQVRPLMAVRLHVLIFLGGIWLRMMVRPVRERRCGHREARRRAPVDGGGEYTRHPGADGAAGR